LQLCENYIHKRQEGKNVKAHYEFGNDSMKVCFKHKTRMKVDHKIKILELFGCVFITEILMFEKKGKNLNI
jgi:hypothetical protein